MIDLVDEIIKYEIEKNISHILSGKINKIVKDFSFKVATKRNIEDMTKNIDSNISQYLNSFNFIKHIVISDLKYELLSNSYFKSIEFNIDSKQYSLRLNINI